MQNLTQTERATLEYAWWFWAREEQLAPEGDWFALLVCAGRGFGKTRLLSEWVRERVESGQSRRMALVARTAADVRDVLIHGESGIMAVSPPWFRPEYNPSKRRLIWPNGAIATCYSAETPDQLRGPQHDSAACLVGGTLVAMADGSERRLDAIKIGDEVLTRQGPRKVTGAALTGRNVKTLELETTDGRRIRGTENHLIWAGGRFRPLSEVKAGDALYSLVGPPFAIAASIKSAPSSNVFDISVSGAHEYAASGLLVHNCDELASWEYSETFDNLLFGLRLGKHPKMVIATTPKPKAILKQLMSSPDTRVVRGSTYDNLENLAPVFRRTVLDKYEGTALGRQEIYAEILTDVPGALLKREVFNACRVDVLPRMRRIVVGVDPAVSDTDGACHTGIIVAGVGTDSLFYVLEDASKHAHVTEWARIVVTMYKKWQANFIVGETNNGGDLIEALIKSIDPTVAYRKVHASRGKRTRAEPIAMLYEQGKVKHYAPGFPHLEDEFCNYDPLQSAKSPDRLDACVWAIAHLQTHKVTPNLPGLLEASPKRFNPYGL